MARNAFSVAALAAFSTVSPNAASSANDRSIVFWGFCLPSGTFCPPGQCDVPPPNMDFLAMAAGGWHGGCGGTGHYLGLRADGSIVTWGFNDSGQLDVPPPNTGCAS